MALFAVGFRVPYILVSRLCAFCAKRIASMARLFWHDHLCARPCNRGTRIPWEADISPKGGCGRPMVRRSHVYQFHRSFAFHIWGHCAIDGNHPHPCHYYKRGRPQSRSIKQVSTTHAALYPHLISFNISTCFSLHTQSDSPPWINSILTLSRKLSNFSVPLHQNWGLGTHARQQICFAVAACFFCFLFQSSFWLLPRCLYIYTYPSYTFCIGDVGIW